MVGLSQQDVADFADVAIMTVKRWEKPDNQWTPPDDVWSWLMECREAQKATVDAAISAVESEGVKSVQLVYYRTQEEFDRFGREPGPYTVANANIRLVADYLEANDYTVEFAYPSESIYHNI